MKKKMHKLVLPLLKLKEQVSKECLANLFVLYGLYEVEPGLLWTDHLLSQKDNICMMIVFFP